MNQEQNNMNSNNYTTNYNSGLNNGMYNNQNMNVNNSTLQPVNQVESINNQNFNSKPVRKVNVGLIIGIISAVVVVGVIVGFMLVGKGNSNGTLNPLFGSGAEKITKEDIDNYNLKSVARWGNISLGISYLIPEPNDTALFTANDRNTSFDHHGHSFVYSNGFEIFVEKSLEGSTNLNTLPIDIQKEKNSEKYKYSTMYKSHGLDEVVLTKKVIIDKIETVYFESNESDTTVLLGISIVDAKKKYLGYSFKYGDSYYSVYGEIVCTENESVSESEKKEILKKNLHYVINSFDKYNNETFYELDNNFNLKTLFEDGSFGAGSKDSEKSFVINHFDDKSYLLEIDKELINWDGKIDSIMDLSIKSDSYRHHLVEASQYRILEETDEEINGIKMKKYILEYQFLTLVEHPIIYAFVVDNKPYIFKYRDDYAYRVSDNLTEQDKDMYIDSLDIVASTIIRTFRLIDKDDTFLDYINVY